MIKIRRPLSDIERIDWLRLIRTENVGPITFFRLLDQFGTAASALQRLPEFARRGGRSSPLRVPSRAEVEREVDANARLGARLLAACEPEYPEALAAIDDPPPMVSVLGHVHLLRQRAVAVIGARNASLNGRRFTQQMARELAAAELVVVSGMARGIDTSAHEGALAGNGATVAVVAGGVDVVYPEENAALHNRIKTEGAIIAECAIGTQPQARHFPRRNRLISGLSLGVVVVEAAIKSGSLITARLAAEQGREVFAVPGSPLDPRCQGTNNLLRQGATLVQSSADVIQGLSDINRALLCEPGGSDLFATTDPRFNNGQLDNGQLDEAELARAREVIIESLGPSPVPIDELVRGCQFSAAIVHTVLLELELAGRAERRPGNQVNLI
ncbi:MAG: DNA-processing protein DprA [Rhodospirillaceae bacterium]